MRKLQNSLEDNSNREVNKMPIPSILKNIFWKLPFLSEKEKEKIFYTIKANLRSEKVTIDDSNRAEVLNRYVQQLLMNPTYQDNDFKAIIK